MCDHVRFHVAAQVIKIENKNEYVMEASVFCYDCLTPFRFKGLPVGASLERPMVSATGQEARLPLELLENVKAISLRIPSAFDRKEGVA